MRTDTHAKLWSSAESALRRKHAPAPEEDRPRLRLVTPQPAILRPAEHPRLAAWFAVAGVVTALLAVASGWYLGGGGREATSSATPAQAATLGPARIAVDPQWAPVAGVPKLELGTSSRAYQVAAGMPAYAIVTFSAAEDASLLPAWARAAVAETPPPPQKAELLGGDGWSYPLLRLADGRLMEVGVVATTAGVLTVACVAPRESWLPAAQGCARGMTQTSVPGAARVAPSADLAVRGDVPAAIGKLDARRVSLRAKLSRARTPRAQSRIAGRLAGAYAAAAKALPAKGGPTAKVVDALRSSAASHKRLAAAAAGGWPKRYRQARRAVKRDDAAVKRALAQLN